jgi:hypothetical protein
MDSFYIKKLARLVSKFKTQLISKEEAQTRLVTISNTNKIGSIDNYLEEVETRRKENPGASNRAEHFLKQEEMSADQMRLLALAILEQHYDSGNNVTMSCLCGHSITTAQEIGALKNNEDFEPAHELGKVQNITEKVMNLVILDQLLIEAGKIQIA